MLIRRDYSNWTIVGSMMNFRIEEYRDTGTSRHRQNRGKQLSIDDPLVVVGNNDSACLLQRSKKYCGEIRIERRWKSLLAFPVRPDDLLVVCDDACLER